MVKVNQPADVIDRIRDLERQVSELRRRQATGTVTTATTDAYLRGVNESGLEFTPNTVPGTVNTNYFGVAAGDVGYFASQGLSLIRVPFTWDRAQPYLRGPLDETYMAQVDAAVTLAAASNMRAVLDLHAYGRRYVPFPGGFTNDFTASSGTWSGGSLSAGRYISDQATFFSTMSGGDARNPQSPAAGYALTVDAYITAEDAGTGKFPLLWIRAFDNGQPSASASYYQLTLSRFDSKVKWSKSVNGTVTSLGSSTMTFALNTVYTCTIDVNQTSAGNVVMVVNGTTVATFPVDAALTGGRVSVITSFTKAAIDNVTLDVAGDTTGSASSGTYRVGDAQISTADFADVWGRLAARYAGNAAVWAYDLCNEPHDMPVPTSPSTYLTTATVTLMYQAAIGAIRAADANTWIILNLDQWSGFQSFVSQYGSNPDPWWSDPSGRTMVGAHYYQDDDHSGSYTGSHATWTQALRDRIPGEVTPLLDWAASRGVQVFAGEYGVPFAAGTDQDNWRADLNTFLGLLDAYRAHGTYWAGGTHYTAATSLEPRTGGVVDYTATPAQMPVVTAHLSGRVPTVTATTGGTGLATVGPAGNVLTSTGAAWTSAPPPTGLPTAGTSGNVLTSTGSVWTSVPAPTAWYNVRAFGATGDGVTDDTAAIQATVDAIPAAGGVLYLPTGGYKLTSDILLKTGVTVQGDGSNATVLTQTATNKNGLTLSGDGPRYVSIRNLKLTGPSSGTGHGIQLTTTTATAVASCDLTSLFISGFGGNGVETSTLITSVFSDVRVQGCTHGFHLVSGTSVSLISCYANGCSQIGYFLDTVAYSTLSACATDTVGLGYYIASCRCVVLEGCGCEGVVAQNGQDGSGYKISGSSTISLVNCFNLTNNAAAFYVTGSSTFCTMLTCREATPGGSATAAFKVDAGSTLTLINPQNTTGNSLATSSTNLFTRTNLEAHSSGTMTFRLDRGATTNTTGVTLQTAGSDKWVLGLQADSTDDVQLRNAARTTVALLAEDRATAPNLSLLTATKSYGGGVGVLFVANASTLPTTNPTGGGILYVDSGGLRWRGSSGTVTTIAPA